MKAGLLRHRVVLQRGTATQNAFGELTQTWTAAGTVWAAVEPLVGREYVEARQIEGDMSTRIRLRWRNDVTELTRVTWTDPADVAHVFEVVSVQADPTHAREMVLMCREVE